MGGEANNWQVSELRMAAIIVWHHQHMGGADSWAAAEATAAEQAKRVERFRAELQRIIWTREDISIRINGGCVEAEIEDIRFVALELPASGKHKPLTLVTLLGRCPSCGMETLSEPIYDLAGLGKMLEQFEPIHRHLCFIP